MPANPSMITGWSLPATTALLLGGLIVAIVLGVPSADEAVHAVMRVTARVSLVLFLLAFTASAAWQLWPNAFTGWQRRNRRYIGVSFAISHFTHFGAILSLSWVAPAQFATIPLFTWILGGMAYALLAAMAATSFDRSARAMGPKAWTLLHTVGSYYIWLIFANSYVVRAWKLPEYAPVAIAVLAALMLRIIARWRKARANAVETGPLPSSS